MDTSNENHSEPTSGEATSGDNSCESSLPIDGCRPPVQQTDGPEASSAPGGGQNSVSGGGEKVPAGGERNSRAGRKPLLDEVKRRKICAILALGGTRDLAAYNVGCSRRTIVRTMRRDPAFAQQVCEAETDAEILFLRTLKTKQWRAAAWALERIFPERYARRAPDTITHHQLHVLLDHLGRKLAKDIPSTIPAVQRRRDQARVRRELRDAERDAPFNKDPLKDKIDEQKP